jgi:CheY-like chemotaxis protein
MIEPRASVVLFIEKTGERTRSAKARLRERGVRVLQAEPGPEAADLARAQVPELVVVEGEVDSLVAGLVAGLADPHGPQPPILLAVPEEEGLRDALRRKLGPLYYSATLVAPDRLYEAVVERLGMGSRGEVLRKPPALVLCVDDDPLFLKSLRRTLTRQGYRVVTCGNASEAMDIISRVGPDVALVDVMMPGMDGIDLTDVLEHGKNGPVPVVLLSGLSSDEADEARYEGHCRGARFFLTKPCETQKLLDVIDYLIGDLDEDERRVLKARI